MLAERWPALLKRVDVEAIHQTEVIRSSKNLVNASQQLSVTALVFDGKQVDLRSKWNQEENVLRHQSVPQSQAPGI